MIAAANIAVAAVALITAAMVASGRITIAWLAVLGFAGGTIIALEHPVRVALAKPTWIATVPARDGSVVLCIDTSGSMASTDVRPSRIAAARIAAGGSGGARRGTR